MKENEELIRQIKQESSYPTTPQLTEQKNSESDIKKPPPPKEFNATVRYLLHQAQEQQKSKTKSISERQFLDNSQEINILRQQLEDEKKRSNRLEEKIKELTEALCQQKQRNHDIFDLLKKWHQHAKGLEKYVKDLKKRLENLEEQKNEEKRQRKTTPIEIVDDTKVENERKNTGTEETRKRKNPPTENLEDNAAQKNQEIINDSAIFNISTESLNALRKKWDSLKISLSDRILIALCAYVGIKKLPIYQVDFLDFIQRCFNIKTMNARSYLSENKWLFTYEYRTDPYQGRAAVLVITALTKDTYYENLLRENEDFYEEIKQAVKEYHPQHSYISRKNKFFILLVTLIEQSKLRDYKSFVTIFNQERTKENQGKEMISLPIGYRFINSFIDMGLIERVERNGNCQHFLTTLGRDILNHLNNNMDEDLETLIHKMKNNRNKSLRKDNETSESNNETSENSNDSTKDNRSDKEEYTPDSFGLESVSTNPNQNQMDQENETNTFATQAFNFPFDPLIHNDPMRNVPLDDANDFLRGHEIFLKQLSSSRTQSTKSATQEETNIEEYKTFETL